MLKKVIALSGAGLAILSLSACGTSAKGSTTEVVPVPTPVSEAIVIDKSVHTTKETRPIYGAPTVAPGINPYTTTDTTTNYSLIVSYDENNTHTTTWEVSKFAFDMCAIGHTAVKYSDGNTVCHTPQEAETQEGSENTSEEENTDEETIVEETEQAEEELPTVPNGFADSDE